jgi:hypothetical protein
VPEKTDKTDEAAQEFNERTLARITLGAVPRPVFAFLGTVIACALALTMTLHILGISEPAGRVMNAYASRLETSANTLTEQVTALKHVVEKITAAEAKLDSHEARIVQLEAKVFGKGGK